MKLVCVGYDGSLELWSVDCDEWILENALCMINDFNSNNEWIVRTTIRLNVGPLDNGREILGEL